MSDREQNIYKEFNTQSNEKLDAVIKYYNIQFEKVKKEEKELQNYEKSKILTPAQKLSRDALLQRIEVDKLNLLTLSTDVKIAKQILNERLEKEKKKGNTPESLKKSKTIYHTLVNKHLSKLYDPNVIEKIHKEINEAETKEKAKLIYEYYKEILSTQGITFEDKEDIEDPREDQAVTLQRFVRGHQQKQKQKKENASRQIEAAFKRKLVDIKNQKTFEKMSDNELVRNVETYYEFINTLKDMRAQIQYLQNKEDRTEEEEDLLDELEAEIEENIGALYSHKDVAGISQKILMDRVKNNEIVTQGKVNYSVAPVIRNEKATLYNPIQNVETIDNIDKLINLIKLYPSLKDIIGHSVLSDMIKTGTINKDKLDRIKDFFKKENTQITFNVPIRQTISPISQRIMNKKPEKLEDYSDLIPPIISIIRF